MTVSSATTRNSYSGNGSTTAFAYGFKIFATSDLEVVIRSSAGVETIKTLTTHYSVSGAGDASGGNVTFGSAPASGETVIIRRKLSLTQGTDYVENDSFPANSHEDALDRLTMITQQIQEEVGRSLKASTTNTLTTPTFTEAAADRASKFLGFDSTGNTLAITDGPIADAEISSPADAHLLIYDNGDSRWENKAVSGDIAITAAGAVSISSGVIVNADVSGSAAIADSKLATITTADKVSGAAVQVDGAADGTGITLADADKILVDDAGTTKYVNMSQVNAYTSASVAADDVATGDAAASFATSSGAVVVDSQASTTTIDGHTGVTVQSSNSGDITLDSAADITLDAAGNDVVFKSAGTAIGTITNSSSDLVITANVADKDILFKGTDDSSAITALSLDMSEAGKATFNGDIAVADDKKIELGANQDFSIEYDEDGQDTTRVVAAGGVTLSPHGTSTGNTTALKFGELAAGGTNYVGFKAPDAIASDVTWTLPNADGSDGHVLKTDGSGALTWVAQSSALSLANNTNNFVVTATGSGLNGEANLTFDGNNLTMKGPTLTVGDATAEDTMLVFDGNAQDYRIGLDDGTDTLEIGLGNAHGTTAHIISDAAGIVRTPLQSSFRAFASGGTTFTDNTAVKVAFAGETYDTNADYTTGTSRFTAPVDGRYFFVVNLMGLESFGTTDGAHIFGIFYVNNAAYQYVVRFALDGNEDWADHYDTVGVAGSAIIKLDADDYVEFFVKQNSGAGAGMNTGTSFVSFSGELLG